jgi:hypothetical protein
VDLTEIGAVAPARPEGCAQAAPDPGAALVQAAARSLKTPLNLTQVLVEKTHLKVVFGKID